LSSTTGSGTRVQSRIPISRLIHPRSLAVIGASNTPGKFGYGITHHLIKFKFPGALLPINATSAEIQGVKAYPSIAEAPGPVDLALIALPAEVVPQACRDCAKAGVGAVVIASVGFSELNEEGRLLQAQLTEIARETGMRILGPNCMGFMTPPAALALTSSVVFDNNVLVTGPIGLISQSGGLMVSLYDRATTAGIGFTASISLGNQCDLEISDFLEFFIEDPDTKAVCIYAEEVKDRSRFLDLADRCRAAGKPLFLYKAGRTAGGAAQAMFHTASTAGSWPDFEKACRAKGVLVSDDPDDMIRAADAILRWGRPKREEVGLVSPSGGSLTVTTDRVYEKGLRLGELSEESKQRVSERLLPIYVRNPFDYGGRKGKRSSVEDSTLFANILATDPNFGVVLVVINTTRPLPEISRALAEELMRVGRPFVFYFSPGQAADPSRQAVKEAGCPYYDNLDSALRVLSLIVESGKQVAS